MKNKLFVLAVLASAFVACHENKPAEKVVAPPALTVVETPKPAASETICFQLNDKKDITSCQLVIEGDKVSGVYDWSPYEKDGGHGILSGVKSGDMIIADWTYMIEGNVQAEQIVLKLNGDKLTKMQGELVEKGTKLVMKDPSKAKAGEVLTRVDCKLLDGVVANVKQIEKVLKAAK